MKETLNVQELIELCKSASKNETAKKFLKMLEKSEDEHKKSQSKFDFVCHFSFWNYEYADIDNDSKEINISKKLDCEENAYDFLMNVLDNAKIITKDENAKKQVEVSFNVLKSKLANEKENINDKNKSSVVLEHKDNVIEFELTIFRTTNILSFSQTSLGYLDYTKK